MCVCVCVCVRVCVRACVRDRSFSLCFFVQTSKGMSVHLCSSSVICLFVPCGVGGLGQSVYVAGRGGGAGSCMCVCVNVCVSACVCVCVSACLRVCLLVGTGAAVATLNHKSIQVAASLIPKPFN